MPAKEQGLLPAIEEEVFTIDELAKGTKLSRTTIARLFTDEPGVIRIGHAASRRRKQYFTLRIPVSVVDRVLARMTVRAGELWTQNPLKAPRAALGGNER